MEDKIKSKCEMLIINRDRLKSVLAWQDNRIQIICASLYCSAGKEVQPSQVKHCMDILKKKTGIFSDIRGVALPILACMIDIRGGEEEHFNQLIEAYDILKSKFTTSPELALSAEIIAETYDRDEYVQIVERAKGLYMKIRKQHPFLTGPDDYVMCVILSMSNKSDDALIDEMERCFAYFKHNFKWGSSNAFQSVSHTLTQINGDMEFNSQKVIELYGAIKEAKYAYDKHYGLPMLALLTQLDMSQDRIVKELIEISEWLKENKGFGNFALGEASRMVYAAMLINQTYSSNENTNRNMASTTLSILIAEEIAMMACITAAVVASSVNN